MSATRQAVGGVVASAFAGVCGVAWAALDMAKIASWPPGVDTWAGMFPAGLVLLLCLGELAAAFCLLSGRRNLGLVLGTVLLLSLLATVILSPPPGDTPCGCFGDLPAGTVAEIPPLLRVVGFGLVHILAAAAERMRRVWSREM